jgi:hypothetical protein
MLYLPACIHGVKGSGSERPSPRRILTRRYRGEEGVAL